MSINTGFIYHFWPFCLNFWFSSPFSYKYLFQGIEVWGVVTTFFCFSVPISRILWALIFILHFITLVCRYAGCLSEDIAGGVNTGSQVQKCLFFFFKGEKTWFIYWMLLWGAIFHMFNFLIFFVIKDLKFPVHLPCFIRQFSVVASFFHRIFSLVASLLQSYHFIPLSCFEVFPP